MNSLITFVTGIWDKTRIGLLNSNINLCIYADPSDQDMIWQHRDSSNTRLYLRDSSHLKGWFEFSDKFADNSADGLYGPLVLGKMFMLHDVKIFNPFSSKYFFWIDQCDALSNEMLEHLSSFRNIPDKFVLSLQQQHQIDMSSIASESRELSVLTTETYNKRVLEHYQISPEYYYTNGIFGGCAKMLSCVNSIYYGYLKELVDLEINASEKDILTVIYNKHGDLISGLEVTSPTWTPVHTGVDSPFHLLDKLRAKGLALCDVKTSLYVLSFNFPDQFESLLKSFENSDTDFLSRPRKILLNNSTDPSTNEKYDSLCLKYDFEQIKKNNIGICGGRQYVAEHFDQSDSDYYIFFEDDMLLHSPNEMTTHCKCGFRTWIPNLYERSLKIMHTEEYHFLKINFTEVYGNNSAQFAWYNVPANIRAKYFPDRQILPRFGLDPSPPLTKFEKLKMDQDLAYLEGDVYYCNWPLWMSKDGNKRVFLNEKYESPYEQTWMSLVFQAQRNEQIKAALLLLSPINHDRQHYYRPNERKENAGR